MWITTLAIAYPPPPPVILFKHFATNRRIKKRLIAKLKSSHPVATCQLKGRQQGIAVMRNSFWGKTGWIWERLYLSSARWDHVKHEWLRRDETTVRDKKREQGSGKEGECGPPASAGAVCRQKSGPDVPLYVCIKHKRWWPRAKNNDLKSWQGTLSVCVFILGMHPHSNGQMQVGIE